MDTPFINTEISMRKVSVGSMFGIAPVAKAKPIHIKAATMPKASLNQYMALRGFMFIPSFEDYRFVSDF